MSSPEFMLAFGVKSEEVLKALEEVNVFIDTDEVYLVDEGVFSGMYSGVGYCPEWLGIELGTLDNSSAFIDMRELDHRDSDDKQVSHKEQYIATVERLLEWLKVKDYLLDGELNLPEPRYFIACGTE